MRLKTIPLLVPQAQCATFERLFGATRTAKKAAKRGVRTVKRAVFDSEVPMWLKSDVRVILSTNTPILKYPSHKAQAAGTAALPSEALPIFQHFNLTAGKGT